MTAPPAGSRRPRRVIVVSGPSGAGKGTLIRGVLKYFPDLAVAVSATTRKPRPGEVDGREYWFLDDDEFDARIERGELLEWVNFAGNRYGSLATEVDRIREDGKHVVLELELEGALRVRDLPGMDPVLIFIEPPDFAELERRLRARAADSDAEIEERMAVARAQVDAKQSFDHAIVNDDQDRAIAELQHAVAGALAPDTPAGRLS